MRGLADGVQGEDGLCYAARLMFKDESTGEVNFRVVFYGPSWAGKMTALRWIHDHTPDAQKSELTSIDMSTEVTVFFEIQRPGFGELDGKKVRLLLSSLHGDIEYEDSSRLILKNADAVVFLADAQRERQEVNAFWAEALAQHLAEQKKDITRLPLVTCVTKSDFENADAPEQVLARLGLPMPSPGLVINPTTGQNIPELIDAVLYAIRRGLAEGTLTEEQRDEESGARARIVEHYRSVFGEDIQEYWPTTLPGNRPGFMVVEHRPTRERPYYTYVTAGLSLWSQLPGGPQPRLELIAYSPSENQRIADVLIALAMTILAGEEEDAPYKVHDTVTLEELGLIHERFVLAPPMETLTLEAALLHVVPVTEDELQHAIENGTPSLLEKMKLTKRGKPFGWGRGPKESVLRKGGFFGMFN
ncbi:suppressor of fused domain protein [Archangium sp. Cb G35]|uniref:suppressor of fused domain protein n=1 Tax=Archangium sp. Cb G35 TaxID=1920190 RepID=UPI0013015D83|nr:suppressor of fused domain protein [Archangium sp. Cb G35]